MISLPTFVQRISSIYSVISRRIEELIVVLNESQPDEHTRELSTKIINFLEQLERSLGTEVATAKKTLSAKERENFLQSIRHEVGDLQKLKAYLSLASKKPTPMIIRKINELYREVEREIGYQEMLAA